MIIPKTTIPDSSILKNKENMFNYIDSFYSEFSDNENKYDITQIMKLFTTSGSAWAVFLMKLRDKIAKRFGLKTSETSSKESCNYEIGSQHGIFKIFDKTDNEIILGENDKHLNFKVSLLLEPHQDNYDKTVSITTVVQFNNLFGKLYFFPVKPFHKLIVNSSLKNIIRQIENK